MLENPENYFPQDYIDSRRRFLLAAGEAGAALDGRVHETARGARGEALWIDAARLGPPPGEADSALLILSGTHGVEGFCGAGAQIATLHALDQAAPLPPGTALLMVHAVNPYGYAWLRRANEENVDLNRNFIDWTAGPPPRNAGYDAIREIAQPAAWDGDANLAAADAARAAMGDRAWRAAHSGGQYQDAAGVFYGGDGPSWSQQALFGLLDHHLQGAKRLAVLDYHTGLGPPGQGERIAMHDPGGPAMARLDAWFGGDVTSTHAGTAVTVPLSGTILDGIERRYADAAVSAVALEFGTIDNRHVQLAVRADNWLHHHGELDSPQGFRIKQQIRDAFHVDAAWWKRAVWARGVETQRAMLDGLAR